MASICSGVMLRAKRYIRSRQVQKLSCASPATSVSPPSARWKACECRLTMPGITRRALGMPGAATASACTAVKLPRSSHCSRTFLRQPSASSAWCANRAFIGAPRAPSPRRFAPAGAAAAGSRPHGRRGSRTAPFRPYRWTGTSRAGSRARPAPACRNSV